jgi:hypothetical protein
VPNTTALRTKPVKIMFAVVILRLTEDKSVNTGNIISF